MTRIGVVTVARSDYGIYRPVLRAIRSSPDLELMLFVAGSHLSPAFGLTVREIEEDGFPIAERVDLLLASSSPEGIAKSLGLGVIGFAQAFARGAPDLLMVLGDRFEMYAAALAALPFGIPLVHLHGGESSEGAMDEAIRHALTKMSHLHGVSTAWAAERVVQMGEEPWRVIVSGAPGLDAIAEMRPCPAAALGERIGCPLTPAPLLVTFHPVTLEHQHTARDVEELMAALHDSALPVIFTWPGADTHHHEIVGAIERYLANHDCAYARPNLGSELYLSLLPHVAAMVGNSSSGIIEAASFALPVVNVGSRQRGRRHGKNVLSVPCERIAIAEAVARAVAPAFRASLAGMVNPYGDGRAAPRIVQMLRQAPPVHTLLSKRFYRMAEVDASGHARSTARTGRSVT